MKTHSIKFIFAWLVAGLLFAFTQNARAQSALDGFDPNANGAVHAVVVQPDGKIIIGGAFTSVAPNGGAAVTRNRLARFNPDGTLDATFNPNANGDVYVVVLQSDGKILIAGVFTSFYSFIVRLNADGSLDDFYSGVQATIYAIAVQPDGKILVGGSFTGFIQGQEFVTRNRIARLNADGSLDATFNPNADNSVFAIVVQPDGRILIGGNFNALAPNGGAATTRNNVARLNADGSLDATFDPNANSFVNTIAVQADGKILLGGVFSTLSPNGGAATTRNNVARLNADGSLDSAFDPNADSSVISILVQPDGKILIGGNFTAFAPNGGTTVTRRRVARLERDGAPEVSFNPNAGSTVLSIAVSSDGKIILGGNFNTLAPSGGTTVTRNRIARLERDGRVDQTLDINITPPLPGSVYVIAVQPDGKIIIGGSFTNVLGTPRNNIARLNADGTLDTGFNPNADSSILAIVVQADGKILVGGVFSTIGGRSRSCLARLDATTGAADAFDPNPNSGIITIAVQANGKILVGGTFTRIGGQFRSRIARLDATTGAVDSFNPGADNSVWSIAVQADGKILVGGFFNGIGGSARNWIARLDATTGQADSFNPNANSIVVSVTVQADGKILAGGQFTSIGGQPRNYIARLNATTGAADSFNPNAGNLVYTIAVQADGKILAGGEFTTIGGQVRGYIARLDAATGTADTFNPGGTGAVNAIAMQADGKILAGGAFMNIGGQPRNHFARLSNDTAALSTLLVSRTTVTLTRDGAAAQFARVIFEQSLDNGATYTTLGTATNSRSAFAGDEAGERLLAPAAPTVASYTLTGLNLPTGQNILIRARGFYRSGYRNASETIEDKVQNIFLAAPTAAAVSLSGRVVTSQSLGLTNALVTLTGADGNSQTVITGKSGVFRFAEVTAGKTYILSVRSKRYRFAPQIITANDNLTGVNFAPQ